jgi:hypothetical protein
LVAPFVVTNADRSWFLRCRRAWDWSAHARSGLEPVDGDADDNLARAVRDALAVYYFPGMWSWDRSIVAPLVAAAAPPLQDVLAAYGEWATSVDRFTPVRVSADLDVAVPDPVIPSRSLATESGEAVRYRERVDLVVVADEDERFWLIDHRVVSEWVDVGRVTKLRKV